MSRAPAFYECLMRIRRADGSILEAEVVANNLLDVPAVVLGGAYPRLGAVAPRAFETLFPASSTGLLTASA